MEKIIYAKMSNDRAEKFRVQTLIIEDGENKKVVKKPNSVEAAAHVALLEKHRRELSEQYKDSGLKVNHCHMEGGSAVFEYIEGESLEDIADQFLLQGKKEQAEELMLAVAGKLHSADSVPFEPGDCFEEVFGNIDTTAIDGKLCAAVADVDLILSNILIRDGQMVIIDYEWTFDFLIPTSFVVYRMLHYYVDTTALRQQLDLQGLCEGAGITIQEVECFQKMERAFQDYIDGRHIPLRKLYEVMGKKAVDVIESCRDESLSMQVYFDDGNGCRESNSYRIKSEKSKVKFDVVVDIPENVHIVRIDPMDEPGVVVLHELRFKNMTDTVEYTCNGKKLSDKLILFEEADPMFIIPCESQRELIVNMWVEKLGKEMMGALDDLSSLNKPKKNLIENLKENIICFRKK